MTAITTTTTVLLVVVAPLRVVPTASDLVFIHPGEMIQNLIGRSDGVTVGAPVDGSGDLPRVIFYLRQ